MFSYVFFRIAIIFFKLLPFRIIYFLSDITAFLLKDIIKYRKKVVLNNLKNSFPEKNKDQIYSICKKFYKHLADIFLESFKGYSLNKKNLLKRFKVLKTSEINKLHNQQKNIIYAGGHIGNWEWGTRATPYYLKHSLAILYKPLKNKYIDKYLNNLRKKDNATMQSIYTTARAFLKLPKPFAVIMLADQSPAKVKKAIWTKFLNQQTACLHGIELYAKKFNMPVVFFSIDKIKRGYYQVDNELISANPRDEKKGDITKKYMHKLEQKIKQTPQFWLWSHKRWKHKKK